MNITIRRVLTVSKDFREFLKHQKYEEYVFKILQRSRKIFDGTQFRKNEDQSHGQCDFIYKDGIKYEVKLLIDQEQGALIGDSKKHNDINAWVNVMINEVTEYGQCIKARDPIGVKHTKLYSIMKDRLKDIEEDENAIFFSIFPLVDDSEKFIYRQFATDFLQAVVNQLLLDKEIGSRKVFFLYPSMKKSEYVLRDSCFHREYILAPDLDDILTYEIV